MKVVVVGAGIAGLAAAYELARTGVDVLVLEAEGRAGGVIVTEAKDGFLVEGGPDGFLAADPEIPALARELGITDRVVGQTARGFALWTGTELTPLGDGEAAAVLGLDAHGADLSAGFHSFAGGMAEPVAALAQALQPALRFRIGVTGVFPARRGFRLSATGGTSFELQGAVIALPAYAAARLLRSIDGVVGRLLGEIRYYPSLTVSLAYREEQVTGALAGTGFVVRPSSGLPLRACTFSSAKFPGRAPAGHVLLRAFLAPQAGAAERVAHEALAPILGLRGVPLWARVFDWPRGLPQYGPHHAAHLAEARARLRARGNLALAGAGYDGPGVSACVRSGRSAARALLTRS